MVPIHRFDELSSADSEFLARQRLDSLRQQWDIDGNYLISKPRLASYENLNFCSDHSLILHVFHRSFHDDRFLQGR